MELLDYNIYKRIKNPYIFLLNLGKIDYLSDDILYDLIKINLRYFSEKMYKIKLMKIFKNIYEKSRSIKLVASMQIYLELKYKSLKNYKKYRLEYNYIKNNNLNYNLNYWNNKLIKLKYINDSSYGDGYHLKILCLNESNKIIENEILNRLILISRLVGLKFYKVNNITIFSVEDFKMLNYEIKKKIYFGLLRKISQIINNNIEIINKLIVSNNRILNLLFSKKQV